jgi:hypothetical protein
MDDISRSTVSDSNRRLARRSAGFAGVLALLVVAPAWCVIFVVLNFAGGASPGLFGEPPKPADSWWVGPADIAAGSLAIWAIYAVAARRFDSVLRRLNGDALAEPKKTGNGGSTAPPLPD